MLSKFWRSYLIGLAFYSRLAKARVCTDQELASCAAWLFVCGLTLGLCCTFAAAGLLFFLPASYPPALGAVLAALLWLALEIYLSRALHWDGLGDIADALGSGRQGDGFRQVLKDSRLGTFGVLCLLIVFSMQLVSAALLSSQENWLALLLAPAWSRSMACWLFFCAAPYNVHSLGGKMAFAKTKTTFWANIGWLVLSLGMLKAFGASWLSLLLLLTLHAALLWHVCRLAKRHGGYSGDFIGYLIESGQTLFLLACLFS